MAQVCSPVLCSSVPASFIAFCRCGCCHLQHSPSYSLVTTPTEGAEISILFIRDTPLQRRKISNFIFHFLTCLFSLLGQRLKDLIQVPFHTAILHFVCLLFSTKHLHSQFVWKDQTDSSPHFL